VLSASVSLEPLKLRGAKEASSSSLAGFGKEDA